MGANAAFAENQNAILGVWATQENHGRVMIEPCNSAVCARVLDGDQIRANPNQTDIYNPDPAKRSRLVRGLYILQGFRGGPTRWSGGSVYDPRTGDGTSDSTLTLISNGVLRVEGCRLLFCRSEIWTREHADFPAHAHG